MENNTQQQLPHFGNMLNDIITQQRYLPATLAKDLGVSPMVVWRMVRQKSVQLDYVWKLSKILGVNFFQMLASQHPVETPTAKEIALQKQVEDLQRRVEIYQELLVKKG